MLGKIRKNTKKVRLRTFCNEQPSIPTEWQMAKTRQELAKISEKGDCYEKITGYVTFPEKRRGV